MSDELGIFVCVYERLERDSYSVVGNYIQIVEQREGDNKFRTSCIQGEKKSGESACRRTVAAGEGEVVCEGGVGFTPRSTPSRASAQSSPP